MAVAVTKAGPYYDTGSISFSSLRTNFKELASGSISFSELRRNTTTTNTDPVVPDATENANISTSSNIKLSQFRGSIKYYYVTQTATNVNFNITNQTWNSNLPKNVKKWVYIDGLCGSNSVVTAAATFNATAYNLTIDISGIIMGASGPGGTLSTISGSGGGNALSVSSSGGNNIVVFVRSDARIYGGGGGGEKGAYGATGSSGLCSLYTETAGCGGAPGCPSPYYQTGSNGNCGGCCQTYSCGWSTCCSQNRQCRYCRYDYTVSGGAGGEGGNGGPGRGYNNTLGSLSGAGGSAGGANNGCGSTDGGTGETGGSGGDWASAGGNTTNSGNGGAAGKAITGSNYSVTGTVNSTTIKGSYQPS